MGKVVGTIFIILYSLFSILSAPVYAISDPRSVPNNKFGIHIAVPDSNDIRDAARLVNTNGDWGYITIVIREDERDHAKWQNVMNQLREERLIPIIRIATKGENGNWRIPRADEAKGWADFLNSLRWVTKNRYVILFNEPNHATEWGGAVHPEAFADVAIAFAAELKNTNPDFFVMLGGLDLNAPDEGTRYMSAETFYSRLFSHTPYSAWSGKIDGITSHSYPNPGFAGYPWESGRSSVRGYEWEIAQYQQYGFPELPVFITETGWKSGARYDLGPDRISEHMRDAYDTVWLPDNRVIAVTPFILNYQAEPFLGFSWRKQGEGFYPVFETVATHEKAEGEPLLNERISFISPLPTVITEDSNIEGTIMVRNDGESIIDDNVLLQAQGISFGTLPRMLPGEVKPISYTIISHKAPIKTTPFLIRGNRVLFTLPEWNVRVIPSLSLKVWVSLLFSGLKPHGLFEIQLFDAQDHLVMQRTGISPSNGALLLDGLRNVIVGERYRVVVLRPYYLPRQEFITIREDGNELKMKPMLPIDFNNDGSFTKADIVPWIK